MNNLLSRPARTNNASTRIQTYRAKTVAECLIRAKAELGPNAMILSKKTVREGAWFGRWGGREMVEISFSLVAEPIDDAGNRDYLQKLETQIAGLTASVQTLTETKKKKEFVVSPVEVRGAVNTVSSDIPELAKSLGRRAKPIPALKTEPTEEPYASLMRQLLDAEVAAPLARQLIGELAPGMSTMMAATELRTLISQRLLIANRIDAAPLGTGKTRLLAFVGTTGVGKTTTIAKLAAQFSLVERRKVGVITLDTQRIAAAQQLQTYGEILRVPVLIAHDRSELIRHLSTYADQGMEMVLLDTAGRSPNEMLPLGETAHLFDGVESVQKFLAIPATLSVRDMENIVARFQNILSPDALIMTKLDEASDNACFGKLLTIQAKFGIPLAYVTTGQKVPDDIAFPDSHAIAARILSTAVL